MQSADWYAHKGTYRTVRIMMMNYAAFCGSCRNIRIECYCDEVLTFWQNHAKQREQNRMHITLGILCIVHMLDLP